MVEALYENIRDCVATARSPSLKSVLAWLRNDTDVLHGDLSILFVTDEARTCDRRVTIGLRCKQYGSD